MHMTSTGKGFKKVSDYGEKLQWVTKIGQAKMLAMKVCNVGNFSRSFSKEHSQQA